MGKNPGIEFDLFLLECAVPQQGAIHSMPGICRKPDSGLLTVSKGTVRKSILLRVLTDELCLNRSLHRASLHCRGNGAAISHVDAMRKTIKRADRALSRLLAVCSAGLQMLPGKLAGNGKAAAIQNGIVALAPERYGELRSAHQQRWRCLSFKNRRDQMCRALRLRRRAKRRKLANLCLRVRTPDIQ
jgi:hypothetical protein